jgi:putative heme-binding domain-containing protein
MRLTIATLALCAGVIGTAGAQAPPAPLAHPSAEDVAGGAKVFANFCSRCHGHGGGGGMGPPLARPRLRRADRDEAVVDIVMNGIPGTSMPPAFWLSERQVVQVVAFVRSLGRVPEETLPGDPTLGRDVYARVGCAACHIIQGSGSGVGPDLSDIGGVRGSAFLRESVVDPAAAQPEKPLPYEPYSVPAYLVVHAKPKSGAEITGIRINEDPFTIQLRDAQGRFHSLRKDALEAIAADPHATLMPSFRDTVKGKDLDDLVAYLMTRRVDR